MSGERSDDPSTAPAGDPSPASPAKPPLPSAAAPKQRRFGRRRPEETAAGGVAEPGTGGPRFPSPPPPPPGVRTAGEIVGEDVPESTPAEAEPTGAQPTAGEPTAGEPTAAEPAAAEPAKKRFARSKPAAKDAPEGSTTTKKAGRPDVTAVRTRLAAAVWTLAVVCALVLAVAALLVALRANEGNAAVGFVLDAADVLDLGIFGRENGIFAFTGADAEVRNALVNWGLGAVAYLVVGKLLDRILHP